MNASWLRKELNLKFQLGEITLFSCSIPALILDNYFTDIPDDPMVPLPPFEKFSESVEVIAIYSHPTKSHLPKFRILPNAFCYIPSQYNRYWVELNGEFNSYLQKFSSKSRNTLNRKIKKFAKFSEENIVWREFREPYELSEFHSLASKVSAKSYQEKLLDCGLPVGEKFLKEIITMAEKELVRGYILFHADKPIAYIFCPIQNNIVIYKFVGHDPDFQKWSPGTILQYLVLRKIFEEKNLHIFDFTEGEGPHKEFFSTNKKTCADIFYFRRTIFNLCLIALHSGVCFISTIIEKTLNSIGLKKFIKKLFRSIS